MSLNEFKQKIGLSSIQLFQHGQEVVYTAPSGVQYIGYVEQTCFESSYVFPQWEAYVAYETEVGWMTGWITFNNLRAVLR